MSETEDRLYGLMEIAERQQAAVQAALDGLTAERTALGREREALARGVRDLQIGTQGAVRSAVTDSLAGAATEGVAAVQAATKPLLGRLAGVTAEGRAGGGGAAAGGAMGELAAAGVDCSVRRSPCAAGMAGEHAGAVVGHGDDRGGAGRESAVAAGSGGVAGHP